MSKRYKYGELNAAGHPQKGRTLDPSLLSGADALALVAEETRTPRFMKKMVGALKGVVIRVEKQPGAGNSWIDTLFNSGEDKPDIVKVRVRIPEIHANLPDPIDYGPEAPESLVVLYPVFIAKEEGLNAPSPGEVVWVDYGDRENFEFPVYLGPVMNKQYDGGFNSRSGTSAKKIVQTVNTGGLGLFPGKVPIHKPRYNPTGKIGGKLIKCNNVADPITNSPSCSGYGNSQGQYLLTAASPGSPRGDFVELGTAQMNRWVNRNGKVRLARADLENTLKAMEAAFIEENNLEPKDVRQYINDGYRSFAKQACYYEKYKACVKEWKKLGSPADKKPSPAAPPGPGKHSLGEAIDFNRVQKRRGNLLWNWLRENSVRFGWVWAGKNFNPQEPWHYEFSKDLASKAGLM